MEGEKVVERLKEVFMAESRDIHLAEKDAFQNTVTVAEVFDCEMLITESNKKRS